MSASGNATRGIRSLTHSSQMFVILAKAWQDEPLGTGIVSGSHRRDWYRRDQGAFLALQDHLTRQIQPVDRAARAVIFDSTLLHAGPANQGSG